MGGNEEIKTILFPIIVECMEEGGYYAECSLLQGCHVEGSTYLEVVENIQDAIKIFLDSYQEIGKSIPSVPTYEGNIVVTSSIPILQETVPRHPGK